MNVHLAYGRNGLDVDVPASADILHAKFAPGLPDEAAALRDALRQPIEAPALRELVNSGSRVVIVHTDITRATPNARMLPTLLAELEEAGVSRGSITLLNALGTHRKQTEAELRLMLGDFVVENYRCTQHDAWDDANLVSFGMTSFGHPVRLNRTYVEADLRILTGYIEPHLFAGFSGGPKGVLPSIAGFESVLTNHGREMVAHPNAIWGVTQGNPVWEEMREMASRVHPVFLLNVTMNAQRQISGVFAGDLLRAHAAGCAFVKAHAFVQVQQPYDVVVASNSGYPLDQNLYQCVKGMRAAVRAVRKGGAILMCGECVDGIPAYGKYLELLQLGGSPQGILDLLAQPGFSSHDQWQVQVQAQIQMHADVYVHADGLSEADIRRALFLPARDLQGTLSNLIARYGPRGCVLPMGPETVPTMG